MNDKDSTDSLLQQAREFEDVGDYAQSVHFYQRAIDEMDVNDPRREPVISSIEYLRALGTVPDEPPIASAQPSGSISMPWTMRNVVLGIILLLACGEIVLLLGLQSRLYPGSLANVAPRIVPPAANDSGVQRTPAAAPTYAAPALVPLETPNPVQLPSASPSPQMPPAAWPLLPPAPTVPPNPPLAAKTVFEDVFDKGKLDNGKWVYENQKGSLLEWSHGTLRMYSGAPHDGYLYSHTDPFPTDSAFSTNIRWRYVRKGACHAAVGLATFPPPSPESPKPSASGLEVSIWFGFGGVHFSSDQETRDIVIPDWGSDWHDVRVNYVSNQYVIIIDGEIVFTSHQTAARIHTIWFGFPADLGPGNKCEWDTLEIERVRVDEFAQQQGLRSVVPVGQQSNVGEPEQPLGFAPLLGFGFYANPAENPDPKGNGKGKGQNR